MNYSHDDICAKLQGVQQFDPPGNLMGAGEPVIPKVCAANNISMQQPQPAAAPVAPQADWKQVLGQ